MASQKTTMVYVTYAFDDTNPEKEDINYVNSIKEDVQWLGFNWDGDIKYSSNYFDTLYGYAVELIE